LTLNVPFSAIQSAAVLCRDDGIGDIALALVDDARIGYLITWPYLKPGNLAKPQPSLRALAKSNSVAAVLAAAVAADSGQPVVLGTRSSVPNDSNTEPTGLAA
jgi:hypothetical protein